MTAMATVRAVDAAGRAAVVEDLRRRMERMGAPDVSGAALPLPGGLEGLLPWGGLPRGAVASAKGAASLPLGVAAAVTAAGGMVAAIGLPALNWAVALDLGARVEGIAMVPCPGEDPVGVAGVLLDGMDLVLLGGVAAVSPGRVRALAARARRHASVLLVVGDAWQEADVRLEATVGGYLGVGGSDPAISGAVPAGPGRGRVRGLRVTVRARGRGFAGRQADWLVAPGREAAARRMVRPVTGGIGVSSGIGVGPGEVSGPRWLRGAG